MTAKTKAQLYTEIDTNYPDNTSGLITPAIQRATEKDTIDSWQQAPSVNLQIGSAYTFTVDDFGKLVTFNSAVPVGVTLPQATGAFVNFNVMVANIGTGTVTITPAISTIGGAASLQLTTRQCQTIVSDGTNYQLAQNVAVGVGGSGAFPVFNDPINGLILRPIQSTDLPACQFAGLGAVKAFVQQPNKVLVALDEGGAFIAVQPDAAMISAWGLREKLLSARTYFVRTTPVPISFTVGAPGTVNWTAHGLAANAEVFFSAVRFQTQVTVSIASPAVVTWNSHGFSAGQPIKFATSGALPTGIMPATAPVTINIGTSIFTWTGHGLVIGQLVKFTTTGALPTGIVVDQPYYVASTNFTANDFQVTLVQGGGAITLSGTQSGTHYAIAASVTISIASPAVVTWSGHGLVAGQQIRFSTTNALPTGITADTPYYVLATGLASNSFRIAASAGGTAINTSGTQSGTHFAVPVFYVVGTPGANTFNIAATSGGTAINSTGAQSGTHFAEKTAILPGGVTEGTTYFVVGASIAPNSFQVSTTISGSAINFTTPPAGAMEGTVSASTGSDTLNNGLSITTPFSTPQKAIDILAAIDLATFAGNIQLAAGTYTQPITLKPYLGAGPINVFGAGMGQTTLAVTSGTPFVNSTPPRYTINNMRITALTAGFNGVLATRAAQVDILNCDFGFCGGAHISLTNTAIVNFLSNTQISGHANQHVSALSNCTFAQGGRTITLLGTPIFAFNYVQAGNGGINTYNANTFIGGAQGPSASVTGNAVIDTGQAPPNANDKAAAYLPGNHTYTEASGGVLI